ncbi:hypothetical protein GR11A_00240 [Vibrio phage vB_VcorM_GR11A]|nr:hypothetical protein GR11A_00240 [Vibrio phage vB_VcorM_GR11A]
MNIDDIELRLVDEEHFPCPRDWKWWSSLEENVYATIDVKRFELSAGARVMFRTGFNSLQLCDVGLLPIPTHPETPLPSGLTPTRRFKKNIQTTGHLQSDYMKHMYLISGKAVRDFGVNNVPVNGPHIVARGSGGISNLPKKDILAVIDSLTGYTATDEV